MFELDEANRKERLEQATIKETTKQSFVALWHQLNNCASDEEFVTKLLLFITSLVSSETPDIALSFDILKIIKALVHVTSHGEYIQVLFQFIADNEKGQREFISRILTMEGSPIPDRITLLLTKIMPFSEENQRMIEYLQAAAAGLKAYTISFMTSSSQGTAAERTRILLSLFFPFMKPLLYTFMDMGAPVSEFAAINEDRNIGPSSARHSSMHCLCECFRLLGMSLGFAQQISRMMYRTQANLIGKISVNLWREIAAKNPPIFRAFTDLHDLFLCQHLLKNMLRWTGLHPGNLRRESCVFVQEKELRPPEGTEAFQSEIPLPGHVSVRVNDVSIFSDLQALGVKAGALCPMLDRFRLYSLPPPPSAVWGLFRSDKFPAISDHAIVKYYELYGAAVAAFLKVSGWGHLSEVGGWVDTHTVSEGLKSLPEIRCIPWVKPTPPSVASAAWPQLDSLPDQCEFPIGGWGTTTLVDHLAGKSALEILAFTYEDENIAQRLANLKAGARVYAMWNSENYKNILAGFQKIMSEDLPIEE